MNNIRLHRHFFVGLILFTMLACTHQPVYKPEIGSIGAKFSHGGVVYSIPRGQPILKLKLVSAGTTHDGLLSIRMYFVRKAPPHGEYLLPAELGIVLPESTTEIHPSQIHASGRGRPMIRLAELPRQAIELLFPLPPGPKDFPYLVFHWKIHYFQDGEEKVLTFADRFDLKNPHIVYADPQEGPEGDYPVEEYSSFPPDSEWVPPGWMWW